jgi:hypothetical protein
MILASLSTESERLEAFQQSEVFYNEPVEQRNDARLLTSFMGVRMADCRGWVKAQVWFMKPAGTEENWTNTDLWLAAARIPGMTIYCDPNGAEARRFHARNSGETPLYDQEGHLSFQRGITPSCGHFGDNPGLIGLETLLDHKLTVPIKTPVFGSALFGNQCSQNKGVHPW